MKEHFRSDALTAQGWDGKIKKLIERYLLLDKHGRRLTRDGRLLDCSRVIERLNGLIARGPTGPEAKKLRRELHQHLAATADSTPLGEASMATAVAATATATAITAASTASAATVALATAGSTLGSHHAPPRTTAGSR